MEFRHPKNIWKDPRQQIVDFGRVFGIGVFLIGGALQWNKCGWQWSLDKFCQDPKSLILWWMVAGLVLSLSTITSWLMRPVYFVWMMFGQCMGWFVQKVILSLVFFGLFTPTGFLFRRRSGMIMKNPDPNVNTYWEQKKQAKSNKSYYRQF